MIKAKLKMSFYDEGLDMYFKDMDHKVSYLRQANLIEQQKILADKRAVIHRKVIVLDSKIREVSKEKEEWVKQAEEYANISTNDLQVMIDDYNTQIMKLEEAKKMVQKALTTSKRQFRAEFRTKNPFTKLQPLLNKRERLLTQMRYL